MAAALPAAAQNVAPARPPSPPPPSPAPGWAIGGNVGVFDWAPSPFVDVVKSSRGFGLRSTYEEDISGALARDAAGWPLGPSQNVITAVGERPGTEWPTGVWKGRCRGPGRIVGVEVDANGTTPTLLVGGSIQNVVRVRNSTTGVDTVTFDWIVDSTPMLALQFDGAVSDLRIVRPGFDLDNHPLLHPQALDYYKQFQTLRFLDFMGQNSSDDTSEASFKTRVTPGKWHGRKSWEAMAAFFNACGGAPGSKVKGIWWNMPWRYQEADCLALGKLLKSLLPRASLKFPEFSNELWNSSYYWKWNYFLGRATNPADADYKLVDTPAAPDQWVRLARLWALQTARMARAVKSAFPQEFNATLFPVMAGQFWRREFSTEPGLEWLARTEQTSAFKGAINTYVGSLAAAPYLLGSDAQMDAAPTPQALIAGMRSGFDYSLVQAVPMMMAWKALRTAHGIKRLDAYEWQLHTHGQKNVDVKLAASLSADAEILLLDHAHALRDAEFQAMCFLSVSPQTVGNVLKRDDNGIPILDANGDFIWEPFIHTFAWPLNTSFDGPRTAKGRAIDALILESKQ
jgi:hypothetical protein